MKLVFVVDSVNNLKKKISMLQAHFGNDIIFVVKANLVKLFNTYGYYANAVYCNNLAKVIHFTLLKCDVSNLVVCYASLELTNNLLNRFIAQINDGQKIVNVVPEYNIFERFGNACYGVYVKSIFKNDDSMASPKLQFLPEQCVKELLLSHFGNRMFAMPEDFTTTIYVNDKETTSSLKIKPKFNKFSLIPLILALAITAGLIMSLAFWGAKFFVVFIFVLLYIIDAFLAIVMHCKNYFDTRFLK